MDGMAVKAIRLKKGLTQVQFAAMLNVSASCIAAVESGHRAVSHNLRIKIAQAVGMGDEIIQAIVAAKASQTLAL